MKSLLYKIAALAALTVGLLAYAQSQSSSASSPPPTSPAPQYITVPGQQVHPLTVCGACGAQIQSPQAVYVAAPVPGQQLAAAPGGYYGQPAYVDRNPHLPGRVHYHGGVACDSYFEDDCAPQRIPLPSIFGLSDQWAVSANRIHRHSPYFGRVPPGYKHHR